MLPTETTYKIVEDGSQKEKLADNNGYTVKMKRANGNRTWWTSSVRNKTMRCKATVLQKASDFTRAVSQISTQSLRLPGDACYEDDVVRIPHRALILQDHHDGGTSASKRSSPSSDRVQIEVYYETLCPDSYRFIATKLNNVYQNLGDKFMDVQLIPYGKAVDNGDANEWEISCQHGQRECYYNTIAACAIYSKENYGLITSEQQMLFGVCMSNLGHGLNNPAIKECAEKSKISWNNILECASDAKSAKNIQQKMGKLTQAHIPYIQKTLSRVPTVVINEVVYNGESLDLHSEVCKILKGKSIAACK
ncbi:Gamma-interferon-inducible lysosomal thiol reductase [Nymphon striatum]|nr:Gamma-interferon-inducible lysosomal thiol reductase [Nymphon striatum]